MLIQVELRDTDHKGQRLHNKIVMTHCRVIRQSGDGLRLENLAVPVQRFYHAMTVALLSKDPDNPDKDKLDKGQVLYIQKNLERFLARHTGCDEKTE